MYKGTLAMNDTLQNVRATCPSMRLFGGGEGFRMLARQQRNQERRILQRDRVNVAYERLKECVDGNFAPGYFNSPGALAAEEEGLSIGDGVLGHVLASAPDADAEERALELLNRIAQALVASEVENRCHNLHAACFLMLDALHIPVAVVRGSVYATDEQGQRFWLNVLDGWDSQEYRPGHSWLITPSWRVADLALVYQAEVPGNYDAIRDTLSPVISVTSSEVSEPVGSWWRFTGGRSIERAIYAEATQYQNVIGWSQYTSEATTVRYLPSAITLPEDVDDLASIDIRIGGVSPREFFDQNASDLILS